MPSNLANRDLLVVTGKGGVGKSTVAAALGSTLSSVGPTLILEVDPRENVHRMLGAPPSGGEIIEAASGIFVQNLRSRAIVDRIVSERVRVPAVSRRVFESSVYQQFVEGAPGLKELAVLWHALRLVRGGLDGAPMIERVVLDAPATGHGVALMLAPRLVSEVIKGGPVGEMTAAVSDWISDPEAVGIVVVAMAEEMPVTEALELRDRLGAEMGRAPEALIVNALYPGLPGSDRTGSGTRDELGRLWRERRQLNDAELARLRRKWRSPDVEVPLLPLDGGPQLIAAVGKCLAAFVANGNESRPE